MHETAGNMACQEEPRVEVIGGEVVMFAAPSAAHEYVTESIYGILYEYLRGKPCKVFHSSMAVILDSGDEYLPDVKVVCDRSKIQRDGIHGAPDLVAEVLSPSTARYDRGRKMRVYEQTGVREYWIVDPERRTIEQYVREDGRFVLRDLYTQFSEYDRNRMSEKEKAEAAGRFNSAVFEDLAVTVAEVFADLGAW